MTAAPVITTDRLVLRAHQVSDMDAFWAFYQSNRARYMTTPNTKNQFWHDFTSEVGSWALFGYGPWAIETTAGDLAGQVAITQPPSFPELELGWVLFDGFEGQGLACEAAQNARDFAFKKLNISTLVSYIDQENTRSIALAERLGAQQDLHAAKPDPEDIVYRHPSPQEIRV